MNILDKLKINHRPSAGALDLLKYIGPGLLVTVGFIDPGNWATNLAAGSEFGYALLWVVTFSSIMLIIIQHNVAHLGIVTGLCLSEATNKYMPRVLSRPILISAMLASISTSLAEVLGGAIALRMLFGMPIKVGAVIVTVVCLGMLLTNTYSKIERWIIMFVSIIGLSFLFRWFSDAVRQADFVFGNRERRFHPVPGCRIGLIGYALSLCRDGSESASALNPEFPFRLPVRDAGYAAGSAARGRLAVAICGFSRFGDRKRCGVGNADTDCFRSGGPVCEDAEAFRCSSRRPCAELRFRGELCLPGRVFAMGFPCKPARRHEPRLPLPGRRIRAARSS